MMSNNNTTETTEDWSDFDFSSVKLGKERVVTTTPKNELTRTVVAGIVGGAIVWPLRLAFEKWVMWPLFCRTPDTAEICIHNPLSSFIIALVIVGVISMAIMFATRTHRALVVSLATFVSVGALWGVLYNRESVWLPIVILAVFTTLLYLFFTLLGNVKKNILSIVMIALSTALFWLINVL